MYTQEYKNDSTSTHPHTHAFCRHYHHRYLPRRHHHRRLPRRHRLIPEPRVLLTSRSPVSIVDPGGCRSDFSLSDLNSGTVLSLFKNSPGFSFLPFFHFFIHSSSLSN
ncbi:hypothetical protein E2C01_101722 [Portunus trituberculatus]|uniref:Uncharacterized protein n=1 Tax=Portunus trituberculatus TaxID=210409 RepID=A0A5B7KKT0_PORTR|nr:hypothetical protein [Portunus trituberculatus]